MYPGGNRRWVPLDHLFKALQPVPHFIAEGLFFFIRPAKILSPSNLLTVATLKNCILPTQFI